MIAVLSRFAVAAVLVAALGAASAGADELRPVKVRMDWQYQGVHAPFFVALDRGYYKAAGLDVEILAGQGSGNGLKTVSSGSEEFGFLDAGVAALGISKGAPVKVVAGIIQNNPTVVVSRKDKPIASPKDMEGKTVAWPPGVAANFFLTAMWKVNGVDESKIEKVSTTREAAEALFLDGGVDAGTGFITSMWPAYLVKGYGDTMQIMSVADFGVNPLSLSIVANSDLIAKDRKVVDGFVAATLHGLSDVVADPEAGWKTVVKYRPELDPETARKSLEFALPLLHTKRSEGHPLGWMDSADWDDTVAFLKAYLELTGDTPAQNYFTNEFIPAK